MVGIIVELLISWILLKYLQHQNLNVLGLMPTRKRLLDLCIGLLWPIIYVCVYEFTVSYLVQNPYHRNLHYRFADFLHAIIYLFKSVAFEDLLFRGAILYILIERIGVQKALIISAVAFGIYHWFSWSAFGNPAQMAIIFLTTGFAGYYFALAFQRTKSMYLPAGLHFGIDFANMVIFSHDKGMGAQLLLKTFAKDPTNPGTIISVLIILIYFTGFPLLTFWWLKRKKI